MKTCSSNAHEDCVVVWEEYVGVADRKPCPLCKALEDNELLQKRITDLEAEVQSYEEDAAGESI